MSNSAARMNQRLEAGAQMLSDRSRGRSYENSYGNGGYQGGGGGGCGGGGGAEKCFTPQTYNVDTTNPINYPRDRYTPIDKCELDHLVKKSIKADKIGVPPEKPDNPPSRLIETEVTKVVEVPYVDTVQTEVKGYKVGHDMEKRTVKTVQMEPVTKYRDVKETHVKIVEEKCVGTRMKWVQVPEEYEYIVKKPVEETCWKKVPYTDYVEKCVEYDVHVPVESKSETVAYRTDQVLKGKLVEVKEKEVYELKPHKLEDHSRVEVKEVGKGNVFGVVRVGENPIKPDCCVPHMQPSIDKNPKPVLSNRGYFVDGRSPHSSPSSTMADPGYGDKYGGYQPSTPPMKNTYYGTSNASSNAPYGGKPGLDLSSVPMGYSRANSEYLTSTERKRRGIY